MNKRLLLVMILSSILFLGCQVGKTDQSSEVEVIQISSERDFWHAQPGRVFEFPRDHGPHNEYLTEWWYYTGNLASPDGRDFGFQLTFFRRALVPTELIIQRESNWAADQVYMAHFAISDINTEKFLHFERLERGAAGLAGAGGDPGLRVWLLDWQVEQTGLDQYKLIAQAEGVSLELTLIDIKGPILQGNGGYSQKGSSEGNASYYYSQTRLQASGRLVIGNADLPVAGDAWMDHEFGTSVLEEDQVGWDWFALQLDDGSELMVFTLRKINGEIDENSQGMLILPDGSQKPLKRDQFLIEVNQTWKSPHSQGLYPASWLIKVPSEELFLEVSPLIPDQELRVSFTYWEGAVAVEGMRRGADVRGRGYVELTGYAHSMQGRL